MPTSCESLLLLWSKKRGEARHCQASFCTSATIAFSPFLTQETYCAMLMGSFSNDTYDCTHFPPQANEARMDQCSQNLTWQKCRKILVNSAQPKVQEQRLKILHATLPLKAMCHYRNGWFNRVHPCIGWILGRGQCSKANLMVPCFL